MIPKIIHQIMPRDRTRWHPMWRRCQPSWKVQFLEDEFEYKIWYDDELHKIVEESYPQYLEIFNKFPRHILKIDFARFCILHKYGGIYTDIDIYCYKNFYKYLNNHDVYLIGSTVPEDRAVENSLMIAKPNSVFFMDCIEESKRKFESFKTEIDFSVYHNFEQFDTKAYEDLVKTTTGIYMVSDMFKAYTVNRKCTIAVLNSMLFQPPPSYYSPDIITKHMCSNWWGQEEVNLAEHLFKEKYAGVDVENLDAFVNKFYSRGKLEGLVSAEDFDFYTNYREGIDETI